jgi:hypothetical protein
MCSIFCFPFCLYASYDVFQDRQQTLKRHQLQKIYLYLIIQSSEIRLAQSFCSMFCISLFVLFLSAIILSRLPFYRPCRFHMFRDTNVYHPRLASSSLIIPPFKRRVYIERSMRVSGTKRALEKFLLFTILYCLFMTCDIFYYLFV